MIDSENEENIEEEIERLEEKTSESEEDIKRELERLRAENETLKKNRGKNLEFKVSQKGALSVYGLGRFPVTLYKNQWQRLIDSIEALKEFMENHDDDLK